MMENEKIDKIIEMLQKISANASRQEAEFYYNLGVEEKNRYLSQKYLKKCIELKDSLFMKYALSLLAVIAIRESDYNIASGYFKQLMPIGGDDIEIVQNYTEFLLLTEQYGTAEVTINDAINKLQSTQEEECINKFLLMLSKYFIEKTPPINLINDFINKFQSVGIPGTSWDFTDDQVIVKRMGHNHQVLFNDLIKVLKKDLNLLDFKNRHLAKLEDIINATYGIKGKFVDATIQLRSRIKDGKLIIPAGKDVSNSIAGDPYLNQLKKWSIKYKVSGEEKTVEFKEDEKIELP